MTDVSRTKILRCCSGMGCRLRSFRGVGDRLAQMGGFRQLGSPPGLRSPPPMETQPHPTPLAARLEVLGAAALFSSGGAVIKAIHFAGWQVAGFRSAVAAVALFLLMREVRRRPTLKVLGVGLTYAATMI